MFNKKITPPQVKIEENLKAPSELEISECLARGLEIMTANFNATWQLLSQLVTDHYHQFTQEELDAVTVLGMGYRLAFDQLKDLPI